MKPLAIPEFLTFTIALSVGFPILFRNYKNKSNRLFFLMCMGIAVGSLVDFFYAQAPPYNEVIFWHYMDSFWFLRFVFIYHFFLAYIKQDRKIIMIPIYSIGVAIAVTELFSNVITDLPVFDPVQGYFIVGNPNFPFFGIGTGLMFIIINTTLIFVVRYLFFTNNLEEKKPLLLMISGIIIGDIFVLIDFFSISNVISKAFPFIYIIISWGYVVLKRYSMQMLPAEEYLHFFKNSPNPQIIADVRNIDKNRPKIEDISFVDVNRAFLEQTHINNIRELNQKKQILINDFDDSFSPVLKELFHRKKTIVHNGTLTTTGNETIRYTGFFSFLGRRYIRVDFKDITNEVAFMENLLKWNKMDIAVKRLAALRHDLKSLFFQIEGNLHFMEKDMSQNDYFENTKEIFGVMKEKIFSQIHRYISPEDTVKTDRQVDILELINVSKMMLGNSVKTEIHSGGAAAVTGEREALEQVFLNLLINAAESMDYKGRITVKTEKTSEKGSIYLMVSISDTGRGIPRNKLNYIFEPFFTTKEGTNTGMGLYLSQYIVAKHNGRIEVKSSYGKGTTFRIYLPLDS